MSADKNESPALVRTRPSALTNAGPKSLAARGRDLLRNKEAAAEWLRKGLELRDAAPEDPRVKGPINPYAVSPANDETKLRNAIEYGRLIKQGDSAEVAAKKLHMTSEDEEFAKTAHFFMPDALARFAEDEEKRIQGLTRRREEMLNEAFRCFEKGHALDPMNSDLLYWLADSYYWGCGVQEQKETAVALYRRAADHGHSNSQYCLGVLCSDGEGVAQDEVEAAVWFRKAAEQGNTDAMVSLGLAYKNGSGVPEDYAQGAMWLRRAGEKESLGDPI